jgi:hypothetical protein
MFGMDRKELVIGLNIADEKKLVEFVNLPCFNDEDLGLLCILLKVMPDISTKEMIDKWGVSKTLADFLFVRLVACEVLLGSD